MGGNVIVIITREGIVVADAATATQALLRRFEEAIASGEATAIVVRQVENGALVAGYADDVNDVRDLHSDCVNGDLIAFVRDAFATTDGIVNAGDADFANLRVWRDLDQDGVSDQGELFMLASLGISGIRTGSTAVNQNLGNGNVLNRRGTYVRSNGAEGTAGTVQEVSNLNFAEDSFNRRFTDQIPILDEVKSLPNMAASGRVRDLWEAANDALVRAAA